MDKKPEFPVLNRAGRVMPEPNLITYYILRRGSDLPGYMGSIECSSGAEAKGYMTGKFGVDWMNGYILTMKVGGQP